MTPDEFIRKWEASTLKERSAAQEHFLDLCALLGEPTPADADPTGESYCFEKGATKATGGQGFADVWKRECFAWEYKGPDKNLEAAHAQLLRYAHSLENPPLLIVSDTKSIVIRTNWTSQVQEKHVLELKDLRDAGRRDLLKYAFSDPERLKPKKSRAELTKDAADDFSTLAQRLRERGHAPEAVAHFVNRLVFCMFAEDVDLLPDKLFEKTLRVSEAAPEKLQGHLTRLFAAMKSGGEFGLEHVPWFNGGLFDDDTALALDGDDLRIVYKAARMYWGDIDPSILGTLFERGLDPSKRSQLGAHYTDRDKIMMIVGPVIVEPLRAEWAEARAEIETHVDKLRDAEARIKKVQDEGARLLKEGDRLARAGEADRQKIVTAEKARATKALAAAQKLYEDFLERLRAFRVLDPACGSGNFLYLSLQALKDIERDAGLDVEALGLKRQPPRVGPEAVKGIEINPYAAELARVSIWIGEIQWMRKNGFDAARDPILRPLDTIECRDALIEQDGSKTDWPAADVIVGNPPFLGGKLMRTGLGDAYVDNLFAAWRGVVRHEADLVLYWFAKAGQMLRADRVKRVGLVATNSIRGGANRATFKQALGEGRIFDAWADEPWIVDGAAVRVSLLCFETDGVGPVRLGGQLVGKIHTDLTASVNGASVDLTSAARLSQNQDVAFMGDTKGGAFDIPGDLARRWLALPVNPNGRPNRDVLKPWVNGLDLTRRPRDMWIIDFGWEMDAAAASFFEAPFQHIEDHVHPVRSLNKRKTYADFWWRHVEPRQGMWMSLRIIKKYVATPTVAKHRLFTWFDSNICPDHQLIAIARDDDTTFGILHSKFHEIWSLRMGTWLGVGNDPRYTPTTCFETFPFPAGLTPDIPAADYAGDPRAIRIASTAKRLNELRENWLNPADLVKRVPEVVPGYPDRLLPVDDKAAAILKKRTLTNLYNERPAWLDHAHRALDEAVAAAYGWEGDFKAGALTEEEILKRLFELNQARTGGAGR